MVFSFLYLSQPGMLNSSYVYSSYWAVALPGQDLSCRQIVLQVVDLPSVIGTRLLIELDGIELT